MTEDQIDRKIAVIFATDVVGYSKSMEVDEAQTIKNLRACRRLLDASLKQYDGRIFNTAGDSVLAEFSSAVSAVECAANFQRNIMQRNENAEIAEVMKFRVGINMGDVVMEGENLYGDGVNIAARLEALAQPNGISVSKPVYEFVQAKTNLSFNDLGMQQVKENKFHVFDVLLDSSQKRSLSKPLFSKLSHVIAMIIVVAVAGVGVFFWSPAPTKQKSEQLFSDLDETKVNNVDDLASNLPVVLVRPFKNLNNTSGNDFSISDSVTETILIGLQRYEEIVTLSSSTSYHVVNSKLSNQEISELYSVNYVVSGTVQQSGKAIRVTVELIDLASQRVGWAEKFDFSDENLFDAQDQIGDSILTALQIKAVMGEQATFHKESATAYTIMLNTRRHLRTLTKDGWTRADSLLQELLASDASEHMKMNMSVWHRVVKLFVGLSEDKPKDLAEIIRFSDRALALNPDAASHSTRAFVEANIFKNCEKALHHAQQLRPLARSGSDYQFMGLAFTNCGELALGISALEKSLQMTPNDTDLRITKNLMSAYLLAERFGEAIEIGQRNLGRKNSMIFILLAYAEAINGNEQKAREFLDQQLTFPNAVNRDSFYQQMAAISDKDFLDKIFRELTKVGLKSSD